MNILLLAHTCGPNRGSEPGTAWNLAWQLAADNHVWVLTHPQHGAEIDAYLVANPRPNLHFVYVSVNPRWDTWDPKRGERGLKIHYVLWQRAAGRKALEMCRTMAIDVAHHVTLGTVNAPPSMHKLPVPVVWGPLGGGQTTPMAFKEYFPGTVMRERIRNIFAQTRPYTFGLRRMARKTALALAKNMETLRVLERAGAKRSQFLLDCGLPPEYVLAGAPARPRIDGQIELLWAGRLEQRKAPRLAIEALASASDVPATITFVGDGPEMDNLKQLSRDLKVESRVKILGKVAYQEMRELFHRSHALLFTSLRDSTGCVVLEAMAKALPVVILDHQGVACFVPDEAGLKVAVNNPKQVIADLAQAYRTIWKDPKRCEQMANAGLVAARKETWDQRARLIAKWYEEVIADQKSRA